jgi:hypothetical protein
MNLNSRLDKFVLHMRHKLVRVVQGFKTRTWVGIILILAERGWLKDQPQRLDSGRPARNDLMQEASHS